VNGEGLLDAAAAVGSPWLQGALLAVGTLILEDPTTIGAGLLVADGKMAWQTAFFGLWFGIALGDVLLYALGRILGPGVVALRLLRPDQIERAHQWFNGNLLLAVAGSRFVPGMRTPVYVAAGLFRAHPLRFLCIAIGATLAWTVLLLAATIHLGQRVLPMLGAWRWPVVLGSITILVLGHAAYRWRRALSAPPAGPPLVSVFEFWPPWLFYLPVGACYAWLSLRHRSLTLPSAANPRIFSGGLIFESKTAILDLVGEAGRPWIAPYVGVDIPAEGLAAEAAEARMRAAGLDYPVVAKPDQGQRGAGVRVVRDRAALADYLAVFPRECRVVLQALVPFRREASILYYRYPDAARGEIYSVTDKEFPVLRGDGAQRIEALLRADPRASLLFDQYARRLAGRLDEVPPAGAEVPLVFAGNHAQGAIFHDGRHLVTGALRARIEAIAAAMPEFHFGRFDIRYRDAESFGRGEDFQIVEINGAGAEATHIWDARTRLRDAYGTLFGQWRILFEIGAAMRRRGQRPMGVRALLAACLAYRRLAKHYPGSD
jgi:membrane protein DedA with SNARE-associated domain